MDSHEAGSRKHISFGSNKLIIAPSSKQALVMFLADEFGIDKKELVGDNVTRKLIKKYNYLSVQ